MKNILVIFLITFYSCVGILYAKSSNEINRNKYTLEQKVKDNDDRRMKITVSKDEHMQTVDSLKRAGCFIDAQMWNRKTQEWTIWYYPPTKSANNTGIKDISDINGVYYGHLGNVLIEDTWKHGKLIQRKIDGKLVDLDTYEPIE